VHILLTFEENHCATQAWTRWAMALESSAGYVRAHAHTLNQ
jgi:hypothetical protein